MLEFCKGGPSLRRWSPHRGDLTICDKVLRQGREGLPGSEE